MSHASMKQLEYDSVVIAFKFPVRMSVIIIQVEKCVPLVVLIGSVDMTVQRSAYHVIYHVPGVVHTTNVQNYAMKYVIDQYAISAVEIGWIVVISALEHVENPV